MILKDKRNHSDCFFVCDFRPDFEKVERDVRRSLEPFKDLDSRFDPSSIALTKRSRTLSNSTCVSPICFFFRFQVYCLSWRNNSRDTFLKTLF